MTPDAESEPADRRRPWRLALAWAIVLGALFFSTYGAANWLASQRTDVGSVVFGWERAIPFWAWTIVPYWTIDAFYGISLFICTTRRELMTHVKRLLSAQALAIGCFIAFPLRFSFERPQTDGLFGSMFDLLMGFDRPFNQAPSLHIVLLVILWVRYAKHLQPLARWVLHAGFFMIGASVLTTYQHHFIDVPTGIWVGWFCIWLFPDNAPSMLSRLSLTADPRRRRIAGIYLLGGLGIAVAAFTTGGAALWLLWITGSLLLVAAIYLALDETAFQKNPDGTMRAASWWLLAPYFVGAWVNSRAWTRHDNRVDRLHSGVMLGRIPLAQDLAEAGISNVVDLTAELPLDSRGYTYRNVPVLDLTLPSGPQLAAAAQAIETALAGGPTLVCCALGYSRSALACAAWLLLTRRAESVEQALAQLRQARPSVVLGDDHVSLLRQFVASKRGLP